MHLSKIFGRCNFEPLINKKSPRMKKSLFLTSVLLCLFGLNQVFTQPEFTSSNPPFEIHDCRDTFTITIRLTNLELYPPAGTFSKEYFPTNRPPMYLQYNFGNIQGEILLNEFEFEEHYNNVVRVYKTEIKIPYDLCYLCHAETPDAHGTVNVEGLFILVTPVNPMNPTMFVEYPACKFTGKRDIFSCDYLPFGTTCTPQGCDNEALTTTRAEFNINCRPNNNRKIQQAEISQRFEIHPSPFNNYLRLSPSEDIEELNIYNANGQLIFTEKNTQLMNSKYQINTTDFASGIYFVKLKLKNEIRSIKIVKP